jgi:hypothetical protein
MLAFSSGRNIHFIENGPILLNGRDTYTPGRRIQSKLEA